MLLSIITGGTGCGKSQHLYELISENLKNNPDSNAVLIVPEQFSYTAEKTLAEKFGGLGLNRVEVLTLSRLISRHINMESGLLPSGKMMLITKAISKISDDNVFFVSSKKQGLTSRLSDLFSEFKRYNITPDDLFDITLENPISQKKLASVREIFKSYNEFFGENFTDSDDAPKLFAEYIMSSDTFNNTFFFFDEYNDFMPQHYDIIRALIIKSRGVFTTLTIGNSDPDGVFAPVLKTKSRLSAIALSEGAQLYTKDLSESAYIKTPDICHLLSNWDTGKTFSGKCENISIFTARDLYSEVEHTAAKITELVRDYGLRYRDIGVIVGDMSSYIHILSAVFKESDISFFCDEKTAITMHPIARTLLSLFKIIDSNWSYSAVFDYLRTGHVFIKDENGISAIDPEDIDMLENYVLANGIRGKKAWFNPWTDMGETIFDDVIENYAIRDYDLEKLNSLREQIVLPFENFLENKGRTVRAIAEAVYNFLCDINLYEGILLECKNFDEKGLRDESEQFKQVWNTLLEVLDQAVTSSGDDVISRENFFRYIENGLSQCSLSIIPSGIDQVSVGTLGRNAPKKVKALFIIGTLFGRVPEEPSESTILTDFDRLQINEALSKKEKELAPDDLGRIALSNLKLFRMVATAGEKLFVSYPIANSEGNALSPARFITTLQKMFPDIKVYDNVISKTPDEELFSSSKRGFYYMLSQISQYYRENPTGYW
ncbi:MAG: exodeoxyribonuclease V subunit gamma, partial [Clostridia bacterium]|nr:exodeoxyribonuclease V subunit gamma [Clostridia bacterium]